PTRTRHQNPLSTHTHIPLTGHLVENDPARRPIWLPGGDVHMAIRANSGNWSLVRSRGRAAVELLDRRCRWRPFALEAAGDGLGLGPHMEHVVAGVLAELVLGPSAAGERGEARRVLGHVIELDRCVVDPVEICANSDVVHPGQLPNVLDV